MHIGDSQVFSYTGSVQPYTVPCTGLFKLEVWGAEGGRGNQADAVLAGKGGYSVGYKSLTKGDVIYICVGGKGGNATATLAGTGGFNGGANGGLCYASATTKRNGGGGGGATHIAIDDRTIAGMGQADFETKGYIAAAGGGGGCGATSVLNSEGLPGCSPGGAGGGLSGVEAKSYKNVYTASPGNQIGGEGFGYGGTGANKVENISHGTAGNGGGGGGFWGGEGGKHVGENSDCSGAGGSSWIVGSPTLRFKGVVYNPSTIGGIRSGNGEAKITLVALKGTARKYIIGG